MQHGHLHMQWRQAVWWRGTAHLEATQALLRQVRRERLAVLEHNVVCHRDLRASVEDVLHEAGEMVVNVIHSGKRLRSFARSLIDMIPLFYFFFK